MQGSKQSSEDLLKGKVELYIISLCFFSQPSLSWSNFIKAQSPMWVSCSPPIARFQQRLVVDEDATSTNKWITQEYYPLGVIFRQHRLFSINVDWILSKWILFKSWYIRINFYVRDHPVTFAMSAHYSADASLIFDTHAILLFIILSKYMDDTEEEHQYHRVETSPKRSNLCHLLLYIDTNVTFGKGWRNRKTDLYELDWYVWTFMWLLHWYIYVMSSNNTQWGW